MRVLLVDDDQTDRTMVSHLLQQVPGFEHELIQCRSLAEALVQIRGFPFDVILLDLWLPDSEGLETCRRIVSAARSTPVVVMTEARNVAIAAEAIRSGAQDHFVKGDFSGPAITRVLEYAVDRFQFHSEKAQQDNFFHQILSHIPAIIWTTDCSLRITSVQGAGLQLLNFDPQQIIGKALDEYLRRTGDADGTMRAHQRALSGRSASLETEWLRRVFEVRIDALREPKQGIVGTIGVALDVTERRGYHREMDFARLVQAALLPDKQPDWKGFDIFGRSYPARQTCGDWFDYLTLADGSLGLVVGDVSGKGFGPAILSATTAAYLESLAENHCDIRRILESCNQMVCRRSLDGHFAVLAFGRIQPGTRVFTYGGAGDEVLIVGRDGRRKHIHAASGIPVGMAEDVCYEMPVEIPLESGDVVLMLTDGFREAVKPTRELFGVARIVQTVAENLDATASEIFDAVWQAAHDFSEGHQQHDDMTGIVIKVLDDFEE
jgi:PAS domain S-box-containing protein